MMRAWLLWDRRRAERAQLCNLVLVRLYEIARLVTNGKRYGGNLELGSHCEYGGVPVLICGIQLYLNTAPVSAWYRNEDGSLECARDARVSAMMVPCPILEI